jgi:hypothetical protein
MNDSYFLDADGAPLGGKIPLQVRFFGGGDYTRIRGPATAALFAFLRNVRTSIAPTHQRTFEFHGGGRVKLFHAYGITRVEIHLEPEDYGVDVFRKGIWLRPKYLPDESPFLTDVCTTTQQTAALAALLPYEEIKTSGSTTTKPGRPALPGTPGGFETSWLVVDIAEDRPLGSTPIKDGTVKIWRAAAKNAGRFVECRDTPDTYLLSCDLTTGVFYFGNRLAEKIPVAPMLQIGGNSAAIMSYMKLRSYGLKYQNFANLWAVQGFVFFVVLTSAFPTSTFGLYGIDTYNEPATWRLLASESLPQTSIVQTNVFGNAFTESIAPNGAVSIVCSGSNGAGVTSGFTVHITPQPGQRPVLSGSLTLMGNGYVPATSDISTVYRTVSTPSSSIIETKTFVSGAKYSNPPPDYTNTEPEYGDWWTHIIPGQTSSTQGGTFVGGTPAKRTDMFLGGYFPTHPPSSASWAFSSEVTNTPGVGWKAQYSYETLLVNVGVGDYSKQNVQYEALYEQGFSATYTWANGYTGQTISHAYSSSTDYRNKLVDVWNEPFIPDFSETITPTVFDPVFEFVPDPTSRFSYWATDTITATMAVRFEFSVTARCLSTSLSTNLYHDDMKNMVFIPSFPAAGGSVLDWTSIDKDPETAVIRIIDPTNDAKITVADVFALLPSSRPAWAQEYIGVPATSGVAPNVVGHRTMVPPQSKIYGTDYINATDPYTRIVYGYTYPAYYLGKYPAMAVPGGSYPANDYQQINYSYSGVPFTVVGTPAEFATAFPESVYGRKSEGDIIYEFSPNPITLSYPPILETSIGMPAPSPAAGTVSPKGAIEPIQCVMYVDPRTKGYIVSAIIRINENPVAGTWRHAVFSYIGNKFGAIPLQPVLDEWRELGETSPLTDGKTAMIYERRGTSPFIYNDPETYLL